MTPTDLNLTATPKLSKLNRLYRLSAIAKNGQVPSKWLEVKKNKFETRWHWFYIFIYTDDKSFFGFEFDYNDKLVRKLTHEDVRSLFKN